MDDIKLPPETDDDDTLFVRSVDPAKDGATHFKKTPIDDEVMEDFGEEGGEALGAGMGTSGAMNGSGSPAHEPGDLVRITFARFVQLVANHSFIDMVDKNADQPVIVSGNLLADLANAHDRTSERRLPLMFVGGLVIGIVLTYLLVK